ncbi:cryptochrome/photolyase family protein [Corynebacterium fournieri]|uniref:cryptochrome/photolyase family protein n=1 Tax=Corynebacterium fournieri TaxID=1852390 RepID=UPI000A2F0AC9|nr:deoxyribodipyrimidine photo-lyase [Corynebacterium fournieri]WJY97208.1 Deoxyribodipyrimidine photo-lyase [Corynebacterium fournieri]
MPTTLVWFRDDLRVADNPALSWAASRGEVTGLLIDDTSGPRPLGRAAAWWRDRSAAELSTKVPLIRKTGDPREIVPRLARELGAEVAWNRRYDAPELDAEVKSATGARTFPGFLLAEPWEINSGAGTPYRVFTPFYKALQQHLIAHPPQPTAAPTLPGGTPLAVPDSPVWANGLAQHNIPGEDAALARFHAFLEGLADGHGYDNNDLRPGATSRLSAHLRFGELSPGYVWAETAAFADEHPAAAPHAWAFLRQVAWREFAWHRFYHLPDLAVHNVRSQFDRFEWAWSGNAAPWKHAQAFADPAMEPDPEAAQHLSQLAQWQRGETGVPLVDAGMRELWETGTMHNRVRMVAGSWLTKNLGIHWRHGEEWFWDTLVDADAASNPFNWQWVAGSGDDAAPYFRVFNPLTQQEKFDPSGAYVSRWAPQALLPGYPEPMVDIKASRKTALLAYDDIKNDK